MLYLAYDAAFRDKPNVGPNFGKLQDLRSALREVLFCLMLATCTGAIKKRLLEFVLHDIKEVSSLPEW